MSSVSSFPDATPSQGEDGFDIHADQRGRIIGSCVAIFVITDVFVALRLLSRRLARAGYWVSEGWICGKEAERERDRCE